MVLPRGFQQPQKAPEFGITVPPRLQDVEAHLSSTGPEQDAYFRLLELGGRPSHPIEKLTSVIRDAGEYRDIVRYWQEDPGAWQLFSVQLYRWQRFLEARKEKLNQYDMDSYIQDLKSRLHRSGFDFTPYTAHLDSYLQEGAGKGDAVATWLEYFSHQYSLRENLQVEADQLRDSWDRQWQKLLDSGVLTAEEAQLNGGFSIYGRSCADITREAQQQRLAYEEFEQQHEAVSRRKRGSTKTEAEKMVAKAEWGKRARLKEEADELARRHELLRRFFVNTSVFRGVVKSATKHNSLLKWTLQQMPLVATEVNEGSEHVVSVQSSDPKFDSFQPPFLRLDQPAFFGESIQEPSNICPDEIKDNSLGHNEQSALFTRFMQLPEELRRDVWLECLPPRPTAHFFRVVNHPRPDHLKHCWNTREFRLQPTAKYESGYSVVYPLISSCREARDVIWTYYKFLRQREAGGTLGLDAGQQMSFQSFDWIPPDDLIVLCLPPTEGKLLEQHSITFEYSPSKPARHVAVLLSKDLLEAEAYGTAYDLLRSLSITADEEQLVGISDMLKELHNQHGWENGGKQTRIGRLYISVEDWAAVKSFSENGNAQSDSSNWREGLYEVRPGNCNRRVAPERLVDVTRWRFAAPPVHRDWQANAGGLERHIWWLGSGKKGLALMEPRDLVEPAAYKGLLTLTETLRRSGIHVAGSEDEISIDSLCWIGEDT